MRKTFALFVLMLAGAWAARPLLADCPGISACTLSKCPAGAKPVKPGQSIQKEIDKAPCTPSAICVAPGTYMGKIDFHGKPVNLVSSGGPSVTFLDGGGLGPVVTFATAEGKDSILDGFTVRNGMAGYGAGILINMASPTIKNSILTQNRATGTFGRGGGVGVLGAQAHPAILCTQFLRNMADYDGGGLMSGYSANPYLRSDHFEGNSASYGGGIGVYNSGRLDLGWTELIANRASGDGGGIHTGVVYGNVLVRQVWFKNNTAGGSGGGMWVPAGFADVINCTFDGNQAATGGGIAAGFGGMVNVASTLFVRNKTAALINASGSNTSVVNHYNGFYGNTGGDFLNTYGDRGLLIVPSTGTDPLGNSCCPPPTSAAINAGIPDYLFNDANGTTNDMGACGGPALSVYGPMR
jgi:hypothetical protein